VCIDKHGGVHKQPASHRGPQSGAALERRLDKMVAAGRVTEEEAERVRAATTPAERDDATRAIQRRHAQGRIDEAVADGRLTEEDGAAFSARLERGEDPSFVLSIRRNRQSAD
jgi:hypothetical protein